MMRGLSFWLAVALFALLLFPIREYVIDDTYIHLQFAKNLRDGHGLVFNAGDPVAGTTGPLFSLLLGWLGGFGADLLHLAKTLSFAFGFLSLALFYAAASRLLLRPPHALAATAAWAANAWLVRWTPSGMETTFATCLVLIGWLVAYGDGKPIERPRRFLAGFCFGLAGLARPEASLLAALYGTFAFVWPDGRPGPSGFGARAGAFVAAAAGSMLAVLPYAVYAFNLYGEVLPNTLDAKGAGDHGPAVTLSLLIVTAKIVGAACAIEVFALVLITLPRVGGLLRQGDAALHLAILSWAVLLPLAYAMAALPVLSRYLVPILPFVVLYGWWGVEHLRLSGEQPWRAWIPAAALAVSLMINTAVYRVQVIPHTHAFTAGLNASLVPWGKWLKANSPPDALVATPDIGAVAYYSDRRILDLGGLVSRPIVPLMQRMDYDEMVRTMAFRDVGRPQYLVDRGHGAERLIHESPYAGALTPLLRARTESLAMARPGAIDYTLYRIDWSRADSLAAIDTSVVGAR